LDSSYHCNVMGEPPGGHYYYDTWL
jgi:hypothetical protein